MKNTVKHLTRKWHIILSSLAVLLILALFAFDIRLLVRQYTIEAEKITAPIRIALVTDLHSCYYGENQSDLTEAIDAQNPDVILLGGDIFDDVKEDTNTERFLSEIAGRYPIYYVTGNHECWGGKYRFDKQMAILEKYSIPVLSGEAQTLTVNGETIHLCGVDDPDVYMVNTDLEQDPEGYIQAQTNKEDTFLSQIAAVSDTAAEDGYTILLSHRRSITKPIRITISILSSAVMPTAVSGGFREYSTVCTRRIRGYFQNMRAADTTVRI